MTSMTSPINSKTMTRGILPTDMAFTTSILIEGSHHEDIISTTIMTKNLALRNSSTTAISSKVSHRKDSTLMSTIVATMSITKVADFKLVKVTRTIMMTIMVYIRVISTAFMKIRTVMGTAVTVMAVMVMVTERTRCMATA